MIRTYSELIRIPDFLGRFRYLQLHGKIGLDTFGFDRIFNQKFYRSSEWRHIRDDIIVRDLGCDLGVEDYEISGQSIVIHHMNPIRLKDIEESTDFLLNPEYLICTTDRTHKAIHYGDESLLTLLPLERRRNDTCPWKH